jgi:hypothetical protein
MTPTGMLDVADTQEVPTVKRMTMLLLVAAACLSAVAVQAQAVREDAIWARTTSAPITLDGVLNEAAWAAAESKTIEFGVDPGIPGSGWKMEAGWPPTDITFATMRFLTKDNQLYIGFEVNDQSIGGSKDWARFDGFLMGLKDHAVAGYPKPVSEYFYSWWNPDTIDPQPTTQQPTFIGRWGVWPPSSGARTPEQIAAWDAVTVVDGLPNSDTANDVSYTVEMRFDLGVMGYDATQAGGDIVEWNCSIYDTDWFWPIDALRFSSTRTWWQAPWGNAVWYNEVRIHADPVVTTASGPAPVIEPEIVINTLGTAATIDGVLNEAVWSDPGIFSIDIRWGDDALRETYPGVGRHRAGQYQPPINGGTAFVVDPADATVKMYVKDDTLYMGFESRDMVVQYHPDFSRWDGFLVSINDRDERGGDNNLQGQRLSFQVGPDGAGIPQDYLASMIAETTAELAVSLMAGTVVDTLGLAPDTGFTAELALDLTALGYPVGLGDRAFFPGVTLLDGDSFTPYTDSYGTRTWWYREYEGNCCAAWGHIGVGTTAVNDGGQGDGYAAAQQLLNASSHPMIMYSLPQRSQVVFEVFDVRGRTIERRPLGVQDGGQFTIPLFEASDHGAGVYLYRLQMVDPESGALRETLRGKTIYLK